MIEGAIPVKKNLSNFIRPLGMMMIHRGISGAMCMPLFDPCNHVAVCFHMLYDDGVFKLGDLKFKAWSLKWHLGSSC